MSVLFLETNPDNTSIQITGDIEEVLKNRRSARFLKDNMKYISSDSAIIIDVAEDDMTKCIERIKKIGEYIHADVQYSDGVSAAIHDYLQEEGKFIKFSQAAESIRNNHCNTEDFKKFIDSESAFLTNRSLYQLQLLSAYHLAFAQNACNFSVPGAGKTSVVYGSFAYLSSLPKSNPKYVDKLLIVSPLSAFGPWEMEYEECFGKKVSSMRLSGAISSNEKKDYLYSMQPAILTLLSYASIPALQEELEYFLKNNKVMVVLDEAHKIKNTDGGTIATAVMKIAPFCSARVILTGTPAPNGYEDLYNLYKFIWPTKNIIPFHVYQLKDMSRNATDVRVKTLLNAIEPFFIRVKKSDLNITPATEHEPIIVPMGESQRRIYDFLEKKYMNDILKSKDSRFQNDLIKARLVRMMQTATNPNLLKEPLSNFAQMEDFDPNVVSEDTILINEVMQYKTNEIPSKFVKAKELIERIIAENGKVVVWATYIKNITEFQSYLADNNIQSKVLYGATPVSVNSIEDEDDDGMVETREKIIKSFHQSDSTFKVIIANPFAVAESISLHKVCHNAIYLERTFNAAHFIQSKDRIHRYGLHEGTVTNYYYLVSEQSVDEVIHQRLIEKENRLREIIESMPIPLFSNVETEMGDEDIKVLIAEYVRRTKKV